MCITNTRLCWLPIGLLMALPDKFFQILQRAWPTISCFRIFPARAFPPKWFSHTSSCISSFTYCTSSNEIHLKCGLEKSRLYHTPSTRVNLFALFFIFSLPTSRQKVLWLWGTSSYHVLTQELPTLSPIHPMVEVHYPILTRPLLTYLPFNFLPLVFA